MSDTSDKKAYWLVKSEPTVYSFERLQKEKKAVWDGVRNVEARANLRKMKVGDVCFFYHSNEGKAVVGLAKVVKEAYQDPTTKDDWSAVDIAPVKPMATEVMVSTAVSHTPLARVGTARRMSSRSMA